MINSFINRAVFAVLALGMSVFVSAGDKQLLSGVNGESQAQPPQPATNPAPSLSADAIYNILVGEIALQRQDLDLAYKHQLMGADLAKDAVAAERAVRIALHKKDQPGALEAIKRWIEFDPESIKARQIAVMLYMQSGNFDQAMTHLRSLVRPHDKGDKEIFSDAVAAVVSGDDRGLALKLMQSLVSDHASNAGARYAVALIAVMAKRLDVAESETRQAIKINPKMEKAHVLLSRILLERGDSSGAISAMRQALKGSPKSKALRSAYARLLIELDKPKLAYQQFSKLSKLSPDDVDIQFSLGILALQLERYKQAKTHFGALLQSKKRDMDACYYLGRIAELEHKPKAAMEWYGKVKHGNYTFDSQSRILALMADQGDLEKARAIIANMRKGMPDRAVDLYILEGDLLRKHSTHDKVVELYNTALKEHPENLDLLYVRALSASALGRVDILEKDIRFILKQKPDHADALNALGYTLADQTDRYQEALEYIKKALALKPDSPAILDSMGWVQYRLGNHKEALRYLRRAFDTMQDVEIAAHLGELLWVTGKKQEAQKVIHGALKKNPDNKYLLQAIKRLGL